jgi:hypothetical protein
MTQAQQDAVIAAQQKFFSAEAANTEAQKLAAQTAAAVEAARINATSTAPAQAQALVKSANDDYWALVAKQQTIIQQAQDAQVAQSQAQINLQNAITASLQTGAVEKV